MPYLYLTIAIIAEVIATTSTKAVNGLNNPLPLIVMVLGYTLAIWMLTLVVQYIPVGIAYAIWAGLGIVLVSLTSFIFYKQTIDIPGTVGITLIIAGVIVIQLFSKSIGK